MQLSALAFVVLFRRRSRPRSITLCAHSGLDVAWAATRRVIARVVATPTTRPVKKTSANNRMDFQFFISSVVNAVKDLARLL